MARSPSPDRSGERYRRRRSPGRELRRRSRSPRGSPRYDRGGERERGSGRDAYPRRSSPGPGRQYAPSSNGAGPRSFTGRGDRRPQAADVSDDDINAESYQDLRRLKRIKLRERGVASIWRVTPSPPPEERARMEREVAESIAEHHAEQQALHPTHHKAKHGEEASAIEGAGGAAQPADAAANQAMPQEDLVEAALSQREVALFSSWLTQQKAEAAHEAAMAATAEEEDRFVGPEAPGAGAGAGGASADYGTHLRPGEGTAMAAFVQSGQRIPRRGEVGLTSNEIDKFENAGYVMSGNRHARMNAVRIRKENQVYTAEEKAALAMFNYEENKRKEARVLDDMKRLVHRTLGPDAGLDPEEPAE